MAFLCNERLLKLMNEEASEAFGAPSLAFYKSKGLMWSATGTGNLAAIVGCDEETVNKTLRSYTEEAVAAETAGEDGAGDAYGKAVFPSKDWRLEQEFRELSLQTRCIASKCDISRRTF